MELKKYDILGVPMGPWCNMLDGMTSIRSGTKSVGSESVTVSHTMYCGQHCINVRWSDSPPMESHHHSSFVGALSCLRKYLVERGHTVFGPAKNG